jgi:hypothetical protein
MSVRQPDLYFQQDKMYYSLTMIRPVAETTKIKRLRGVVDRGIENGA